MGSYFIGLNTYILGTNWLDPVAWTLAVEILFYVIAAIFLNISFAIRKIKEVNIYDVLILSAILDIVAIILSKYFDHFNGAAPFINFGTVIRSTYLISFMLIGTTFYLHAKERITLSILIFTVLIQYLAFVYVNMHIHPAGMYAPIVPTFSWFAITILAFSLCYVLNDRMKEHKLAGFFADISYPLYLCHSYIGYFLMGVVIRFGILPRSLVIFLPFPLAVLVAYLIHKYVEIKTHRLTFSDLFKKLNNPRSRKVAQG